MFTLIAAAVACACEVVETRTAATLELAHLAGLTTAAAWVVVSAYAQLSVPADRTSHRLASLRRRTHIAAAVCFVVGLTGPPLDKWVWSAFAFAQILLLAPQPRPFAVVLPVLLGLSGLAFEVSLLTLRATPALAHGGLQPLARLLYLSDWQVVQFDPACAKSDPDLIYRLRPGTCTFANTEFETTLDINSAGLRDDEASLTAPEIIVLGDSYAMGWGVHAEQTFAEQLAALTGKRVLNAGIASYGTARELLLLAQLDLSAADDVILQYCGNDFAENQEFAKHGGAPPDSADRYDRTLAEHRAQRYRFPAYSYRLYANLFAPTAAATLHGLGWPKPGRWVARRAGGYPRGPVSERTAEAEAELLVETLARAEQVLAGRRLWIIRLDEPSRAQHPSYVTVLRRALAAVQVRAEVIDLAPHLNRKHYLKLDPHLSATGHALVAGQLFRALADR